MAVNIALKNAAARKLGTQKKFKGKYAGPDKYKGVVPAHLKGKYKGKYFGRESNKGGNPTVSPTPTPANSESGTLRTQVMPEGWRNDPKYANADKIKSTVTKRLKTPEERTAGQERLKAMVAARAAGKMTAT